MHSPYNMTQSMDTRQQTGTGLAALQSSKARNGDAAKFGFGSITPPTDTDIESTRFPVASKNLPLKFKSKEYELKGVGILGVDEAPDSPCTLFGEEIDLDEICIPLSLHSPSKSVIPETPPRSPSTLLGNSNDLYQTSSPQSSGISNGASDAEDQPGSPSTVLGDEYPLDEEDILFLAPSTDSINPNAGSEDCEMATYTSQQYAPMVETSSAPRTYIQWPKFMCATVPLIDEWPNSIVKAFVDEDWKFGLDEKGKTVLEVVVGRKDLEKWFAKMGEKWKD